MPLRLRALQSYLVLKSRDSTLEMRGDFTRCKRWLLWRIYPKIPSWLYMCLTIRGGLAHKIKACTARLQGVLDIVIVPNQILYLYPSFSRVYKERKGSPRGHVIHLIKPQRGICLILNQYKITGHMM
jgi:hypothetical protein